MKRALIATMTVASLDPGRTLLYAIMLRRLRRTHPEMFDGAAAAESVRHCLMDYAKELDGPLGSW